MTTSTRRAVLALAAAATALVTLTACGGAAETITEQAMEEATGGDVAIDDGNITMTDEQGNEMALGENVSVPDTWPSSVPLYDGTLVMVSANADGTATASWTTEGDPGAVADAYGAQLESAGFAKRSDGDFEGLIVREYANSELVISVTAGQADGVTSLTISSLPAS